MKIDIIGAGVVGMATGRGFMRLGHDVTFYDISQENRKKLRQKGYKVSDHYSNAEIIFICTPEEVVEKVVEQLINQRTQGLKVIRSTVLPGTTKRLIAKKGGHICHNPEFLREAVADYEFMNPHRVVIGECCTTQGALLEELYKPLRAPIVRVDPTTSEMIKLTSNAYLATLISYWNEINMLCNKLGINSHVVGKACALDPRISHYGASQHGKAFSGRCLPKDLKSLIAFMRERGIEPILLEAVEEINKRKIRGGNVD